MRSAIKQARPVHYLWVLLLVSVLGGCSREAYSPLMNAAKDGNLAAVQQYLAQGADINAQTSKGKQALMLAASEGHAPVVRLLLEHGAMVDARDSFGTTALIVAATAGHTEVVKLLLEHGADPQARDDSGGTPLVNATFFGHSDAARAVLAKSPPLDKQDGEELLLLAAGLGHGDIVAALLDHGVDVNGRGLKNRTALMAATAFNRLDVVRILLKRGADPLAKDDDGNTALTVARDKGNNEITALLSGKH